MQHIEHDSPIERRVGDQADEVTRASWTAHNARMDECVVVKQYDLQKARMVRPNGYHRSRELKDD